MAVRIGDDGVVDEGNELVQLTGPAQQIDVRVAAEQVCPILLGHAADHADHEIGFVSFARAEFTQPRPDLLLGVLAHGARVVEDHVGVVALVGGLVAERAELPENQLAVEHVHLAAEGLEVQLALHAGRSHIVS